MTIEQVIEDAIGTATGKEFKILHASNLSGGSINCSKRLDGSDGRTFFCKKNDLDFYPFFKAEAKALKEIEDTGTIRVPQVIAFGKSLTESFLALEFLEEGGSSPRSQQEMGKQLARLHKIPQPFFGWTQDNCIGSTPQPNPESKDWVNFYREHRLRHQFALAAQKGRTFEKINDLITNLDFFFTEYSPSASLLHGDLWGGNASQDQAGQPFVFDPASYYGDRETDLAFTYMFGGFSSSFYESYEQEFPLHHGFNSRKTLYNLYHELNHFNLFGGGYATSSQASINLLVGQLP
jgi:fructosamine-3-kinase